MKTKKLKMIIIIITKDANCTSIQRFLNVMDVGCTSIQRYLNAMAVRWTSKRDLGLLITEILLTFLAVVYSACEVNYWSINSTQRKWSLGIILMIWVTTMKALKTTTLTGLWTDKKKNKKKHKKPTLEA